MTTKQGAPASEAHEWELKARFRRHAFGWKSQPTTAAVTQQVSSTIRALLESRRRDPAPGWDDVTASLMCSSTFSP